MFRKFVMEKLKHQTQFYNQPVKPIGDPIDGFLPIQVGDKVVFRKEHGESSGQIAKKDFVIGDGICSQRLFFA